MVTGNKNARSSERKCKSSNRIESRFLIHGVPCRCWPCSSANHEIRTNRLTISLFHGCAIKVDPSILVVELRACWNQIMLLVVVSSLVLEEDDSRTDRHNNEPFVLRHSCLNHSQRTTWLDKNLSLTLFSIWKVSVLFIDFGNRIRPTSTAWSSQYQTKRLELHFHFLQPFYAHNGI